MKNFSYRILIVIAILIVFNCHYGKSQSNDQSELERSEILLKSFDSLTQSKIMIVGTYHFDKEVLNAKNQENISKLISSLSKFNPTKVVIEWEESMSNSTNQQYNSFLKDSFDIGSLENEVYQLGFRLAKKVKNDSIYLFDNQTEFIGSLENFSFDSFTEYADKHDDGFYNKYEKELIEIYNYNQEVFQNHNVYNQIALRNSPTAQKINGQRMHLYEIRVGIQKNWIGPDWLGRWYQRNIRMASNILKMNRKGDRILVIVGDNHKWTLDMLFENIPEFEVISSWDLLKKGP